MNKRSLKSIALKLRKASTKWIKKQREFYPDNDSGGKGILKMLEEDHENALTVADFIEGGDTEGANCLLYNIDTTARDSIEKMIYDISREYYDTYMFPDYDG